MPILGIGLHLIIAVFFAIHLIALELATRGMSDEELSCYNGGFGAGGIVVGAAATIFAAILPKLIAASNVNGGVSSIASLIYGLPGVVAGVEFPSTDRPSCFK